MRIEDVEDRGLSGAIEEDDAGALDAECCLFSDSLSRSRSLLWPSEGTPPPLSAPKPFVCELGVLLRCLMDGTPGDIRTGGRPYMRLSLCETVLNHLSMYQIETHNSLLILKAPLKST